jgi:hypothetical protein
VVDQTKTVKTSCMLDETDTTRDAIALNAGMQFSVAIVADVVIVTVVSIVIIVTFYFRSSISAATIIIVVATTLHSVF